MKIPALILVLVLLPSQISSQSGYNYGTGTILCRNWLLDYRYDQVARQVHLSWVLGFITSTAVYGKNPLSPTDEVGIQRAMNTYCQQHPLDLVLIAAMNIAKQLSYKDKIK